MNICDVEIPVPLSMGGTGVTSTTAAIQEFKVPQCVAKNMILGGDFGTNPCQKEGYFGQFYNVPEDSVVSVADRWFLNNLVLGADHIRHTVNRLETNNQHQAGNPGDWSQWLNFLRLQVLSTTTVFFNSICSLYTVIEGSRWKLFAQVPLVMSFWVSAHRTGKYCITIGNFATGDPHSQKAIFEYEVFNANTWEYKIINIPPSPAEGVWSYGPQDRGVKIEFCIAAGDQWIWTDPIGEWVQGQESNFNRTVNQVNAFASTGSILLANIQVERGTIATGFEYRDPDYELFMCRRFRQKSWPSYPTNPAVPTSSRENIAGGSAAIFNTSGTPSGYIFVPFPVQMIHPTVSRVYDSASNLGQAICHKNDYSNPVNTLVDVISTSHNGIWLRGPDEPYSFIECHYYVDNGVM